MSDITPRLHVENWAPEFGASFEPNEAPSLSPSDIDYDAEVREWRPIVGKDGDDVPTIAFIDGVRRVDARLTLDDPLSGPLPGICGSYAVGAALWDRRLPRTEVTDVGVNRVAVLSQPREDITLPALGANMTYQMDEHGEEIEPEALIQRLQTLMRNEEGRLATQLAQTGHLVIADGPIKSLGAETIVGCIKRHRGSYVTGKKAKVVGALRPGERTPLFVFDIGGFRRFSWYVRLAHVVGGHSWSGIMRCECTASLPMTEVYRLADRATAFLPRVASAQHLDPRAPQNLAPIASLERYLKHMLGDPLLLCRILSQAVYESTAASDSTRPDQEAAAIDLPQLEPPAFSEFQTFRDPPNHKETKIGKKSPEPDMMGAPF